MPLLKNLLTSFFIKYPSYVLDLLSFQHLGVVQAVNNESSGWSTYGHLIADIRTTLFEFTSFTVRHVRRSANQAANKLAKFAVNQSLDCVWDGCCPEPIRDIVVLGEQAFF
jgi:hypothetical protein